MDGDDCVDESKDVIITFGPEFTEEKVEAWLDGHPNFVQSYFTRKANRALLDLFLRHTRAPTRSRASTPPVGGIGESHSPLPSRSSSHSGTSTPVRKISASDFESKGILKPLVSLVDGSPSFLSLERNFSLKPTRQRKSKEELQHLRVVDEQGFLMEIVKDIASDLDLKSLCHKILQNVSILLNADRCSLFLIQGPKEGPRFLVSEVFDVNADSKVEDVQNLDPIRLPWGKGIVGYSAETGESVNIPDAYKVG